MAFDSFSMIRITCPRGMGETLAGELVELGKQPESVNNSFVDVQGTLDDAMQLNLYLRTGVNVLYQIAEFPCSSPDELYRNVCDVQWEDWLTADGYFTVTSRAEHPSIDNVIYVNHRVKDGVVDRMIERFGRRPNSGAERDGFVLHVVWLGETAELFINTSGRKLSDRGYRRIPHTAPMSETLAAGVVLATGYDGNGAFVNPMCGSGTLAIEAALIASGRPPGLLRSKYGFMHVKGFNEETWRVMRIEAKKVRSKVEPGPIIASDIDPRAIEAAQRNAETAGVHRMISFHVCDFEKTPMPEEHGVVILNPEYGLRMGEVRALEETYKRIGDFFKQKCKGSTGYVFTGNLDLAKKVGLQTKRRMVFFNAKIECRLLKYELYEGTRKKPKDGAEPTAE